MSEGLTHEERTFAWATTECELHELIGCSICKPKPPKPTEPVFHTDTSWAQTEAQYDGTCPRCNNSIYKGDSIKRDPKSGKFAHADCVKEP